MKFGIQQLQIGKTLTTEKKAAHALYVLEKAGFDAIELNGFMIRKNPIIVKWLTGLSGMPVKNADRMDWKKLLSERKLEVCSIHEDIKTLETNLSMVINETKEYHTQYVVLTGNYQFDYSNERVIDTLSERLNEIGRKLREENIQFLYHNHNVEFRHINENKLCYDRIIEKTNKEFVNFEFDSYWPSVSGVDAISYMEKLRERIQIHHICDNGNIQKGKSMTPIVKTAQVELGKGCMNLKRMIDLDYRNGTQYIVLEQHKNHIHKNSLESASISIDYLNKVTFDR